MIDEQFAAAKAASKKLALTDDSRLGEMLLDVADAIILHSDELLEANASDLRRMERDNPLYDRLQLTTERLRDIAGDMRHVAELPSPLGHVLKDKTLKNGLRLRRVSVPFGVIGMIYEARPNVTFDVFSLCLKSGNACVLKGGKDAEESNKAAVALIHNVIRDHNIDEHAVELLPATHEATAAMLNAVGYIDLCIPRGGKRLIDFVRRTARVPVIETGAGVVHAYFDIKGDTEMGAKIILNAKTRRVSVCNALDCLIIHRGRLTDLPRLVEPLTERDVILYADEESYNAIMTDKTKKWVRHAEPESFGTEFMDYKMAIKTVGSLQEAIDHISRYGSGHSETIITNCETTARRFQREVDAACVYWNAPTSFTDGAQFGLGAEIGISTQKLGPRGPMALEEMTTYKWIIDGNGQTRP